MRDIEYIVGVEVGGGHISVALVSSSGTLIPDTLKYFRIDSNGSKEDILTKWALPIKSVLNKVDRSKVQGISFAMPGAFDYKQGIALFSGNGKYNSLYNVNISQALHDKLNLSASLPMRYINDATAFAMGVCWKGEARNHQRVMCFTLGTGIGSAFMEDGMPVVCGDDVPEHGCLWHLPFRDGIVDDYFSTRWFIQESELKYGVSIRGVKSLAATARKHSHAMEIFSKFGQNLGEMLAPWLERFRPQCLCFGGNISQSSDLFKSTLVETLANLGHSPQIVFSSQTEEMALYGSTRLYDPEVWDRIYEELPTL
ncbi:ROK family protein [Marinoscillum sp.]|uniref:ROK family protein n=1 Tax=Marinoscillum sp. TaxID=2024838 RepID=UPI003BA8C52B